MRRITASLLLASWAIPAHAESFFVSTQDEYAVAAQKLQPGDVVVLANGTWRDFEIVFSGTGAPDKPITLKSETPGKVIIAGRSNLKLGGRHLRVTGLVFQDGYSPTSEVISFRRTKTDLASDSQVTDVVIDHFNQPDRFQSDNWVGLYGQRNRFDRNYLAGKSNQGVTLAVHLDTAESRGNTHSIDHNYFGPRPVLGSNGGETIRIGTSAYSMHDSSTVIENNVFDRCDGEVEIVSVKSGANVVRGNLFLESSGAVVLRHGDGNLVERNVFLGKGKDHTGGVRVINRNQIVRANYMEGLRGTGFGSALAVMNGVPNSPVNRYVEVDNASITDNSFIDSSRITLAAGADSERSAPPRNSRFSGNFLQLTSDGESIAVEADVSGIAFSGNVLAAAATPISGIAAKPAKLTRAANGLLYPDRLDVGAPRDLAVPSLDDTGPRWYAKPPRTAVFGDDDPVAVGKGGSSLVAAIAGATGGSCLALAPGTYTIDRTIEISSTICLMSSGKGRATIMFARAPLFEIARGGNLRLAGITIRSDDAPDAVGNAVIRTAAQSIPANFTLELDDVDIAGLTVNRAFDVISIGKSAMADRVVISRSRFADISGKIVAAHSEIDDFGRYNVEYLDISASRFDTIRGGIADVYRGGTDESTFGPHVRFVDNVVTDSGAAEIPVLALTGVQKIAITGNRIDRGGPIAMTRTTGEPDVSIRNNRIDGVVE
ncbi:polysaccharide lyase 6 family protein [Blastomonas sp.]|uniref:polysaccharide lyase 6 family protein n=1 Tax=Blastomonas sp. TaxID=1909299 RepID=UPI00260F0FAF|nr:polysaccharide lyase 6 family protein [Blastomonas sp.]MDM7957541.1 polysaccharide lyase 6 family protein [Blastomonas sp.]